MMQDKDSFRYACINDHEYVVTTTDQNSANGIQLICWML